MAASGVTADPAATTTGTAGCAAPGRTSAPSAMSQHDYVPYLDCDNYGAQDEPVHCTHPWYQTPHCEVCIMPMDDDQHTAGSRHIA